MVTVNSTVVGMSGRQYYLEKEIGSGGEGSVFVVHGSHMVAKIYKKDIQGQEQKLLHMVYHHVPNLCDAAGNHIVTLAWPSDVLYDSAGKFIGYIMPMIDAGLEIFEICRGCTSPKAKRMFPNYSWKLNVTVAQNLAIAVDYLHSQNCIIGDLNCKNILVNSDGTISILDADSFDLTDPQTGAHFKCGAGTEDYLAPELQGRNLRAESSRFTVHTDYFALAIHIFQLLMNNYHPFNCRQITTVKNSSNVNPRLQQIGQGKSPFINRYPDVDIPLGAPMVTEVVPYYIRQNFVQTFNYTEHTLRQCITTRTTARKWAEDLSHLLWECNQPQGLINCGDHQYLSSMGQCATCCARRRFEGSRQGTGAGGGARTGHTPSSNKQKNSPPPSSATPAPAPSSSGPRVPVFLYRAIRVINVLLAVVWLAFVFYGGFIVGEMLNDSGMMVMMLSMTALFVGGIFRMEYFRRNRLDHSESPFSGKFASLLYVFWRIIEGYFFFCICFTPIIFIIMMFDGPGLDYEYLTIVLATLPIAVNKIFFALRVNE